MYGLPVTDHSPLPAGEMTKILAHSVMQAHKECLAECCARKRQARTKLVDSGALVLDAWKF